MKKYTVTLTEEQIRMLDETMCVMADKMNDVDETRPGGIVPTSGMFNKYVSCALREWTLLHDFIMDEVLGAAKEEDGQNKPSQIEAKISIFNCAILPFFGEMQLGAVREADIMRFKKQQRERVKTKTLNNRLTTLRNMFKFARTMGYLLRAPQIDQDKIKRDPTAVVPRLSEDNIPRMLTALNECSQPWVALFVEFALETGLRAGEVRALQWNHIALTPFAPDLGQFGLLTVCETTAGHKYALGPTKGLSRFVPLTLRARRIIEDLNRVTKFLFPNSRSPELPCSLGIVSYHLRKLREKGHLSVRVYNHLMRHTYASRLVDKGASVYEVQPLLGHVDVRTTGIYAHRDHKLLYATVNRLNRSSK
ncbi:hypothetical protein Q3G72_023370 [Acer saccharum]|nr:hypothetical protein Q3G72_006759 [Acer saccharum]KAK1548631.1 hypothetical protein Q3G72_023370 [Acer saccharum]